MDDTTEQPRFEAQRVELRDESLHTVWELDGVRLYPPKLVARRRHPTIVKEKVLVPADSYPSFASALRAFC